MFSTSGYISGHPISAVSGIEGTFSTATPDIAKNPSWLLRLKNRRYNIGECFE